MSDSVAFADGETNQTFRLERVSLALSSPAQGAVYYAAKNVAAVRILFNDASIQFSAKWVTVA